MKQSLFATFLTLLMTVTLLAIPNIRTTPLNGIASSHNVASASRGRVRLTRQQFRELLVSKASIVSKTDCQSQCYDDGWSSYEGCMDEGGTPDACFDIAIVAACRCMAELCGAPCENAAEAKNSLTLEQRSL